MSYPNCPLANGKYCIKNHCSGNRTLHVTPNKPGVNNVIGTCDAGSTWDVEYLSDGVYKICLSGGHGVVLDLKESAREAGTPIITYPFCKTPNQKWIITAYCGLYVVTNMCQPLSMSISSTGHVTGQCTNYDDTNQQWTFTRV